MQISLNYSIILYSDKEDLNKTEKEITKFLNKEIDEKEIKKELIKEALEDWKREKKV